VQYDLKSSENRVEQKSGTLANRGNFPNHGSRVVGKITRCALTAYRLHSSLHMHMVKWRHSNLWSRYDLNVAWHGVVLCEVNWWRFVTLFKQNWISRFRRKLTAGTWSAIWLKCCKMYIFLCPIQYTMEARTAGINRSEEITSLSPHVYALFADFVVQVLQSSLLCVSVSVYVCSNDNCRTKLHLT